MLRWSFTLIAESGLISVGDIEEPVIVLSLLVHMCHQGVYINVSDFIFLTSFEQVLPIDEEVEGILLWQLDSLPDDVVEVVGSQIVRDEVPKE